MIVNKKNVLIGIPVKNCATWLENTVKQISITRAFYQLFNAIIFYFWTNIIWFHIYINKKIVV